MTPQPQNAHKHSEFLFKMGENMRNFGEIDGRKVCVTDHALARMVEMKMTPEEIKDLICNPDEVHKSKKYEGAYVHKKSKYSIALRDDKDVHVIITVLYASLEDWCDAAKNGELKGRMRKLKAGTGIPRRRKSTSREIQ